MEKVSTFIKHFLTLNYAELYMILSFGGSSNVTFVGRRKAGSQKNFRQVGFCPGLPKIRTCCLPPVGGRRVSRKFLVRIVWALRPHASRKILRPFTEKRPRKDNRSGFLLSFDKPTKALGGRFSGNGRKVFRLAWGLGRYHQ